MSFSLISPWTLIAFLLSKHADGATITHHGTSNLFPILFIFCALVIEKQHRSFIQEINRFNEARAEIPAAQQDSMPGPYRDRFNSWKHANHLA
jgi:hypothetical protein